MKYLAAVATIILIASPGARAGWCEKAKADYERQIAQDNAAGLAPEVKKANDRINRRMKENIEKGCAPGGFYDQLDKAERDIKEICRSHPDTKGC
jgi:hypothetical protein